jgi:hypothetical protein
MFRTGGGEAEGRPFFCLEDLGGSSRADHLPGAPSRRARRPGWSRR